MQTQVHAYSQAVYDYFIRHSCSAHKIISMFCIECMTHTEDK